MHPNKTVNPEGDSSLISPNTCTCSEREEQESPALRACFVAVVIG